jgi:hypothetical protein
MHQQGDDSRIRGLGSTGTSTTVNWGKEPFVLVKQQNVDIILVQVADALLCVTPKYAHEVIENDNSQQSTPSHPACSLFFSTLSRLAFVHFSSTLPDAQFAPGPTILILVARAQHVAARRSQRR